MAKEDRSKNLLSHKSLLILIKYIPHIIAVAYSFYTFLGIFGIDYNAFGCFFHVSFLTWIILYLLSIAFKYCYVHRLPIYYIGANELITCLDYYLDIELDSFTFISISLLMSCSLIFGYTYYYIKYKPMKDYNRRFCRPKTTKHPEIGDVQVKLNCGNTVYVKAKDYLGIKKSFKIDSVVGETTNTAGNIKVLDKAIDKEVVVSPLTYINNLNKFNFIGVVGNINNSEDGNIICHNTTLNQDAIFSYNDWINLSDDWDLVGLYGITTYEEEDAVDGDYVIMANGHTLIIKPEDYSKVSNNWELVDTIGLPNNVIKYTGSEKLVETTSVPSNSDNSTGLRTTQFNTSIVDHTFENGVGTIVFEEDVTEIKAYAFYNNTNITSITIPNSVTSIEDRTFQNCSGLTSVTIGSGVTSIGKSAFYHCSGLTSIKIPNSVTSIGDFAFSGCSGLTSVTIPNSMVSIGSSVFIDCSGLTSVTIPNSVTSIGSDVFRDCSGLSSITIPNSVMSIGAGAFYGCNSLTSITIPNSVTSIGKTAFGGCRGLTSITIGNSVTSIGKTAFWNCSGLTAVTIPDSVTSIGDNAFYECSRLISVTVEATTPPTLGSGIIPNNVTNIYVPAESVDAYKAASGWSTYADKIQAIQ